MKLKKKQILPFFGLLSVFLLLACPVSADITLHFVDRSFLGDNPVTITGLDGSLLFDGNTSSIATIPAENFTASYWLSFEPGGYTDFVKHPEYGAQQTFEFGAEHAVGILVVAFLLVVVLWRTRR